MGVVFDKLLGQVLLHDHTGELDTRYIKLDQSTPQTVSGGIPKLDAQLSDFNDLDQFVNKRYVDYVVSSLIVDWYATNTDSGVEDYKLTTLNIDDLGDAQQSISGNSLADGDYIAGWINKDGETPSILPLGIYNLSIYAEKTGGNKDVQLYWQLVERKSDNSETVLATSSYSDFLVESKQQYIVPLIIDSDHIPASGSRVVGKIYAHVTGTGNAPSLTIYYENNSMSRWSMPTTTEVLANQYVPYSGANQDVDLGSQNLTTTGNITAGNLNVANWDTAYTHSQTTTGNPHNVTLADVGGTTDHTELSNIGTNTHAQIDSHIADNTIHFTEDSLSTTYLKRDGSTPITANWDVDGDGTLYVDKTNGRVGIGTIEPTLPLVVNGSSGQFGIMTGGILRFLQNVASAVVDFSPLPNSDASTSIRFFRSTNTTGSKRVLFLKGDNSTSVSARIGVDGLSSAFQIDGGNFGIGVSSPSQKLQVAGGWISADNNYGLSIHDTGGIYRACVQISSSNLLYIGPASGSLPIIFRPGSSEKMRITSSGNVGIGTTDPGYRLDVHHAAGTGEISIISRLYNTSSPTANTGSLLTFALKDSGGNPWDAAAIGALAFDSTNGAEKAHLAFFVTNGAGLTEAMRITRSGNVGIGTTEPKTKLHISGAMTLNEMSAPTTPAANRAVLYLDSSDGSLKVKFDSGNVVTIATYT